MSDAKSRRASKISNIGKSIRKFSVLPRRSIKSIKRKKRKSKKPSLPGTSFSSKESPLVTRLEENAAWEFLIEEKVENAHRLREEIRFNFCLENGEEATPAYSMNPLCSSLLSSSRSVKLKESALHSEPAFIVSDARLFDVAQTPSSKRRKSTAESKMAVYDLISADCFDIENKVFDISDYIKFPPKDLAPCHLPEYLVVNILIPKYKPQNPLFGNRVTTGPGVSFLSIYSLSEWAKSEPNDPSIHLFRRFIAAGLEYRKSKNPKLRDMVNRLKNIITLLNRKELSLALFESRFCNKYSNSPWMVRDALTNFSLRDNCFEIDIDLHSIKYSTLQMIHTMSPKLERAALDLALVLEGRNSGEMPERILCNVRFFQMNLNRAPKIDMESFGNVYEQPGEAQRRSCLTLDLSDALSMSEIIESQKYFQQFQFQVSLTIGVSITVFFIIVAIFVYQL